VRVSATLGTSGWTDGSGLGDQSNRSEAEELMGADLGVSSSSPHSRLNDVTRDRVRAPAFEVDAVEENRDGMARALCDREDGRKLDEGL
jgi:hypothetical protein